MHVKIETRNYFCVDTAGVMAAPYKSESLTSLGIPAHPRRTTSFLKYNITVPRRAKNPLYLPSWMEKVQKTRQEMINSLHDARLKEESFISRHRQCDWKDNRYNTYSQHSNRMLHLLPVGTFDGSLAEHEDLEKQYQELRSQLFQATRRETPLNDEEPKNSRTKKTRFKLNGGHVHDGGQRSRARKISDSTSSDPSTGRTVQYVQVSVSELLKSDALGSDHFLKHLHCVKELARRYRRGPRRQRHIAQVLNVQDS